MSNNRKPNLTVDERIDIVASKEKLLDPIDTMSVRDNIKRLLTLGANLKGRSWRKYLAEVWIDEYLEKQARIVAMGEL